MEADDRFEGIFDVRGGAAAQVPGDALERLKEAQTAMTSGRTGGTPADTTTLRDKFIQVRLRALQRDALTLQMSPAHATAGRGCGGYSLILQAGYKCIAPRVPPALCDVYVFEETSEPCSAAARGGELRGAAARH
jgi:hypothetical protein